MLIEMGQAHKQDWYLHLPWVLLSRRVALQPDIGSSSAKLVLGMNPVVPGQLVGDPQPPMTTSELRGLVDHLEAAANSPAQKTSNHGNIKKEFMPATTDTATHCYLKQENPKGLLQTYCGPYKIVDRPSHSTIKVKLGTFKSGAENLQVHHWANAKPAVMREDTPEAAMPTRGRPSKSAGTSPTDSPEPVLKPGTHQSNKSTSAPSAASAFPGTQSSTEAQIKTNEASPILAPKPSVREINKQPTRRSERIKNRNHETSIQSSSIAFATPPPGFEDTVPNFFNQNAWSATPSDLNKINQAISRSI